MIRLAFTICATLLLPVFHPILAKGSQPRERLSITLAVRSRFACDDVVGMADGKTFDFDTAFPGIFEPLDPIRGKYEIEIDLPNGQKYTFQYESTYGKVAKITFPDGGYVRYVWGLYKYRLGNVPLFVPRYLDRNFVQTGSCTLGRLQLARYEIPVRSPTPSHPPASWASCLVNGQNLATAGSQIRISRTLAWFLILVNLISVLVAAGAFWYTRRMSRRRRLGVSAPRLRSRAGLEAEVEVPLENGALSVDVDVDGRIIQRLTKLHIAQEIDAFQLRLNLFGEGPAGSEVLSNDGYFDWGGCAHAHDATDDVGRLK